MKLRTSLLIAAATVAVMAIGFLLVVVVGRSLQAMRTGLSSETARQEFVARWTPPENLDLERMLPGEVQGRILGSSTGRVAVVEFNLDLPGTRGVYERPGTPAIDVYVCRATPREQEGIFERVKSAFNQRTGGKTVIEGNDRLRLSSTQPEETWEIWSLGGWLLLFRAPGELPADFIRAYLMTLSSGAPPPA